MCGLAGVLFQHLDFDKGKVIKETIDHLYKRGPDAQRFSEGPHHLFINTRLSIQDVKHGELPFSKQGYPYSLVYNGELYNKKELKEELTLLGHSFQEDSDTEVVYHTLIEFKENGLSKFDGIFALGFLNIETNELIIARDRFGVKPIFFSHDKNKFAFSSTPFFLTKLIGKSLNDTFISDFLTHNYISTDETPFTDIFQLPKGSFVKCSLPMTSLPVGIKPYWDAFHFPSHYKKDDVDLMALTHKSISDQVIGERNLGLFLSSGIDSTFLAKVLLQQKVNFKAFHISYSDQINQDQSERGDTVHTAQMLNLDLELFEFSSHDFLKHFDQFVSNCYLPLADPGAFPLYFLSDLIKNDVSIVFSGDGADELYAGYPTLLASYIHVFVKPFKSILSLFLKSKFFRSFYNVDQYKVEAFLKNLHYDNNIVHAHWRDVFTQDEIIMLNGSCDQTDLSYKKALTLLNKLHSNPTLDKINKLMLADFEVWLPKNNFLKLDIATMSHSIEGRVPYIGNALYQVLFSLPGRKKWSLKTNKKILRDIASRILPSNLVNQPKRPFHPPYKEWFKNQLYDTIYQELSESTLISRYGMNKEFIQKLLKDHKAGISDNTFKIYNLYYLEKWLTIHFS